METYLEKGRVFSTTSRQILNELMKGKQHGEVVDGMSAVALTIVKGFIGGGVAMVVTANAHPFF
jgi:hypothetical protein